MLKCEICKTGEYGKCQCYVRNQIQELRSENAILKVLLDSISKNYEYAVAMLRASTAKIQELNKKLDELNGGKNDS